MRKPNNTPRIPIFKVESISDGECFSREFTPTHFDDEIIVRHALSILFLNDISPGTDWRIISSNGDVFRPIWEDFNEEDSTAAHYYDRPARWDM